MEEQIQKLANDINNSTNRSIVIEAVTTIRKLLSMERNPPIEQIVKSGVIPKLVQFLGTFELPLLQFESAWALTNIASGNSRHCMAVVDNGAVQAFIHLAINAPDLDVKEQAIWGIGNIASDSTFYRDEVLRNNGFAAVYNVLTTNLSLQCKLSLLRNGTWALSCLVNGNPKPSIEVIAPALQVLPLLLHCNDEEVLKDACWSLSYISDNSSNEIIQNIIEAGVSRRLVELLLHELSSVQLPALRTVYNLLSGDDIQTQVLINVSVIPCLAKLLQSNKKSIRKEACGAISNITAGNISQIQAVIDCNLIPSLISLLSTSEYDIKKEVVWAISNAILNGSPKQIEYIISLGCIKPFCDLLQVIDTVILNIVLDTIERILALGKLKQDKGRDNQYPIAFEESLVLDKLEQLKCHTNKEICNKVSKTIYNYFETEIDDDKVYNGIKLLKI